MSYDKPMIPFIDQKKQYQRIEATLEDSLKKVFSHGQFVLGPEVKMLETRLMEKVGSLDMISLANGTDALTIGLMARGLKTEDVVFVPEFTYCATAGAVARMGAIPYFVDVDPKSYNMCPISLERAILACVEKGMTPVGVIAVDIFGVSADYDALNVVLKKYNLWMLQDAAQSFGGTYKDKKIGSFESLVATSFYPTKPLGCYGDGGGIFVNDERETAELIRSLKVHGQGSHRYDHIHVGFNSRLDTMQAVVLLAKLDVFDKEIQSRRHLASMYDALIDERYERQYIPPETLSAYAQYSMLLPIGVDRASWMEEMKSFGVPVMIYYPKLLSEQKAYEHYPTAILNESHTYDICKRIVAIPMHGYMDEQSTMRIVQATHQALKNCL